MTGHRKILALRLRPASAFALTPNTLLIVGHIARLLCAWKCILTLYRCWGSPSAASKPRNARIALTSIQ